MKPASSEPISNPRKPADMNVEFCATVDQCVDRELDATADPIYTSMESISIPAATSATILWNIRVSFA